jgi:hypothetical protein
MTDAPSATVVLGVFEDFECELVMEILQAHRIYAFPARPLHDAGHSPYPFPGMTTAGTILVDATRAVEARRIIDQELPEHMDSIRDAMAVIDPDDDD